MRFFAVLACWLVALNCAKEATSDVPHTFTASASWFWWAAAVGWVINGLYIAAAGAP